MNVNGMMAERKVANYLQKKHYKLLDYNYKSRFGEIDLIMTKGKYIVFIEVKARSENSIASPLEFVDVSKQKKIIATAKYYLAYHQTLLQPRFDVAEVYYQKDKIKSIKHLENAFILD